MLDSTRPRAAAFQASQQLEPPAVATTLSVRVLPVSSRRLTAAQAS
jgi:hypothetical protein